MNMHLGACIAFKRSYRHVCQRCSVMPLLQLRVLGRRFKLKLPGNFPLSNVILRARAA